MPLGCFWGFQITSPPCSVLAEQEQIWKVRAEHALGGLQHTGTGKQGHVMGSWGSPSQKELCLAV